MNYAKIGLDDLTVPAQIQYGRRLIAGITDNPHFPAPNPAIPAFTVETDKLEAAYNQAKAARLIAKTRTQELDEQVVSFAAKVSLLASYVDNASGGNGPIIESSGFEVRSAPTPVGPLPAPTDLQVFPSQHPGHADMRWGRVRGASAYNIERAEEGAEPVWKQILTTTKREASANSMVRGKRYLHRVSAVGAAGQSAWSTPVAMIAP